MSKKAKVDDVAKKNAFDDEKAFGPATLALFKTLKSAPFTSFLSDMTGIKDLIPDPEYRGSGIHQTLPGGFLGIHADFNRYVKFDLHRRVNVFVFLNPNWNDTYGGHLELWSRDLKTCGAKISPDHGRLVVFSSTDFSYHGQPHPLTCPSDRSRRSLALYYYTKTRPTAECIGNNCYSAHTTLFQTPLCPSCMVNQVGCGAKNASSEVVLKFRILFRTFGVDIPNVAYEFNLFCEGKHPYHSHSLGVKLDGSDVDYPHDLRLHLPLGSGCLRRTGDGKDGMHLAYVDKNKAVQIASGHSAVDRVISDTWFGLNDPTSPPALHTAAIRDDFAHWHDVHDESDHAGKLFLVNKTPSTDQKLIEVFFDDNIERDRAHIVDVRDRESFEAVTFEDATSRHLLHRVEPYLAITDRNYYVDIVRGIVGRNKGEER
eukprot:gene23436-29654_t